MPKTGLPLIPDLDAFWPTNIDVWGFTALFPPNLHGGILRYAALPCLISCDFSQASRTRIEQIFGYTHVLLIDPTIEIHDSYTGDNVSTTGSYDFLACPAGQTASWLSVSFSYLANIPQLGKRRVICADRINSNQKNNAF